MFLLHEPSTIASSRTRVSVLSRFTCRTHSIECLLVIACDRAGDTSTTTCNSRLAHGAGTYSGAGSGGYRVALGLNGHHVPGIPLPAMTRSHVKALVTPNYWRERLNSRTGCGPRSRATAGPRALERSLLPASLPGLPEPEHFLFRGREDMCDLHAFLYRHNAGIAFPCEITSDKDD